MAPEQWLLEQVRIGEAGNKDDLVRQSLYRLELMDPNNPDVIAARMRLALRQGNMALAQQQLDKLKTLAPQSSAYRQAQMNMLLTQPETRQSCSRPLMATAGRLPEAKAQYDALFHGEPPTLDLAVEYWRLVARLPGQEAKALKQLQALDQQYSGNVALRMSLARMLFSQNQDAQAYELLQKIAADPAGRGDAADLWLDKVKAMPVSAQSVAALNRFLGVFDTGDQATSAREELARQQKLLADPAYQARVRGLAQVDKGGSRAAIPELQRRWRRRRTTPRCWARSASLFARRQPPAGAETVPPGAGRRQERLRQRQVAKPDQEHRLLAGDRRRRQGAEGRQSHAGQAEIPAGAPARRQQRRCVYRPGRCGGGEQG